MDLKMLSIGRLLLCVVDVYMIYRFFNSLFTLKKSKKRRILFYILAVFFIFFLNSFKDSRLNLMIMPYICFIFAILVFKISAIQGITYTIIFYAIFAGGREVAYELLIRLLSNILSFSMPPWFSPEGFYYLVPEYLLSFLFLLLIEQSAKKLELREDQSIAWYLLIMPVSSIIVLSSFLYMDFPDSVLVQGLMCAGAFMLYFSNAAVFIILAKYKVIMNQMKYEEMSAMKKVMESDKYQNIARLNEYYSNYIHDVHSHMSIFRMLAINGQSHKIVEMIDEMDGNMQIEISNTIYSSNEVLNAILLEHEAKAKKDEIKLTVFIESFLKLDFISDRDMVSMFGNLLDNALEAAARCELGSRKVDVKLFMGNHYLLVFYIENSFIGSAVREGDRLLTTKEDKQFHGLGIGIVQKLAEKYKGNVSLEEKDNIFITTLIISTCKKPD